jgi:hypothetical protein
MSRLRNYTRGLATGYVMLAVAVVYALVAVRLAWAHLSKAEFGVWVLALTVAGFLHFVDLGMGSSLSRLLIDCKDDRANGSYGGMLKTGMLVFTAQALIVMTIGVALSFALPEWLNVEVTLRGEFFWLLIGLTAVSAVGLQVRVFSQILFAHQRMDLVHVAQISNLAVSFTLLWHCFHAGFGIYSMLIAHAGAWAVSTAIGGWFCVRARLLPKRSEWGRVKRAHFRELFVYGADVFWVMLGLQLMGASQAVVIFRTLGAETLAVWAVATKAFVLVRQMVEKTAATAAPILGEMHSRNEMERLRDRYRVLFRAITAFGGWCAMVFVFCNESFLEVWMKGEERWTPWAPRHNWLLGLWLILLAQQFIHVDLLMAVKQIKGLKRFCVAEGTFFVIGGLLFFGGRGMDWLIGWSIVCSLTFTLNYVNWRVRAILGVGYGQLLWDWQKPVVGMVALLFVLGSGVGVLSVEMKHETRFALQLLTLGAAGGVYFLRMALPAEWRCKALEYLPRGLRPLFHKLSGTRREVE